jgi:hypothetical protein
MDLLVSNDFLPGTAQAYVESLGGAFPTGSALSNVLPLDPAP